MRKPDAATVDYYEKNHEAYDLFSSLLDMKPQRDRFLEFVPVGGNILDLGCGAGRDLLHFLSLGYVVEGADPSPAMAQLASRRTGLSISILSAEQIDAIELYDGVWACASLLHVPKSRFDSVIVRIFSALRNGGCFYMSLKEGVGELRSQDGRLFSLYEKDEVEEVLARLPGAKVVDVWFSEDVSKRFSTRWLNFLVCKVV